MNKTIVITEAHLSPDTLGFNKTAWEFVKNIPCNTYDLYLPAITKQHYTSPIDKNLTVKRYFKLYLFESLRNRIGLLINQYLEFINHVFRKIYVVNLNTGPATQILVIPNTYEVLHLSYLLAKKENARLTVYLMDDWLTNTPESYKKVTLNKIMAYCHSFVFISEYLRKHIYSYYSLSKPYVVFFNPPKFSADFRAKAKISKGKNEISICYIGSIFEMHDSIYGFMEFMKRFNKEEPIRLNLHVYTHMYDKTDLNRYIDENVKYCGFLKNEELLEKVSEYDFGLLATSFSENKILKTVVSTSVLTKLNDYVNADIPIINFGPSYSACTLFVKQHDLGIIIESQEYAEFREIVNKVYANRELINLRFSNSKKEYLIKMLHVCDYKEYLKLLNISSIKE